MNMKENTNIVAMYMKENTNIAAMYMKESNQAYTREVRDIFIYTILQMNTLKFISHVHVLSKIDTNGY